jgi:ATP-dependent DNA ligase
MERANVTSIEKWGSMPAASPRRHPQGHEDALKELIQNFLYAFDLIELDGDDLRREPIERRRVLLIRLLAKASVGLQVNDHIVEPGDVVFRHACQLGFEGIVSKRLGSPYVSGRSRHWIKSKNPQHPAVKREAEEDWAR